MIWPSWPRWRCYLGLGLMLDLLFVVTYGGAGALAEAREGLRLWWSWELSLPLVPQFIYLYYSLLLLLLLPPFALAPQELRRLARQLAGATLVAAALFLLLPTQLGFTRHPELASLFPLFDLLYRLDPPHNLLPSLHVTYATLVVAALLPPSPRWLRQLLWVWLLLLCASTVLVQQHLLLDVVAGWGLAAVWGGRGVWGVLLEGERVEEEWA